MPRQPRDLSLTTSADPAVPGSELINPIYCWSNPIATTATPAKVTGHGATSQATTDNLHARLRKAVGKPGTTAFTAASAIAAGDDFFDVDATHLPQQVDGPPFDSATALIDGIAADTVTWYTDETGSTSSRATMTGRIDA